MTGDVDKLVDHLFRHQYGRLVSSLTRIFGIENLDLVEDVVQETLLKALKHWPYHGVPDNPAGWLYRAARNQALDIIRRENVFREKAGDIALELEQWSRSFDQTLNDDQLQMIFACCHPSLPPDARVALTLKTVGGFGVSELARAFLTSEATIAQRLVRAKRKLREERIRLEAPDDRELPNRLDSVLEVIYLMFNEGYNAHHGTSLIREDMCEEAIRLGLLFVEHRSGNRPATHALLALMLLQAARLPARQTPEGDLLLISEQDRSRWDPVCIQRSVYHLSKAARGESLTNYHLEAGIAACHSLAPSYAETDWNEILKFYNQLVQMTDSPVIALNRAVAVSMIDGPEAGIAELAPLRGQATVGNYYLLHATLGEFYARAGFTDEARRAYKLALELAGSEPEQRFLNRKLDSLQ